MASHQHSFNERFEFAGKAKTLSLAGIVIGVIGILYGFLVDHSELHAVRTFSNLLLMSYYFVGICVAGVFFLAYQYMAQAGWSVVLLRIPQAFAKVLVYAVIILLVIVGAGLFLTHPEHHEGHEVMSPYLYSHWATDGLAKEGSPIYDAIIAGKSAFLNKPFFYGSLIVMLGLYTWFGMLLVRYSNNEDEIGGMFNYNKAFKMSAIFLVIFGFTFPIYAFGTIMSLEAHWFSTMFGWYNLAAVHVSGLAVIAVVLILLKKNGYFSWVNESHLQDLGKLIFGFSIFWTYVWFAQFFLTWYANMPEESVYFYKRWEPEYKWWFWLNIVLNFVAPLFLLMMNDNKRSMNRMLLACIVIIIGHWLDYYLMIMPGTMESHREFGITELFTFIGFAGLFTFLMLSALSKFESLIPKKHPFLDESLHHHLY
ncbi:quinol:cytochrome C oxidoreductase [Mucilaginibacter daejeonensis]|uniref:quinol:cytochrome C oxidoreductase n=1 Tax=Mucilaginibacter daejeonensis TaxID=398049 RepID=UPI001D17B14F|nr:quinol:cytochrome C oxidoreductase [Mucilaginibacter daejeonensis]UEG53962.1 quinol:cytochrome C oxidoreductase [Mucilaginibacter daejeonensis]